MRKHSEHLTEELGYYIQKLVGGNVNCKLYSTVPLITNKPSASCYHILIGIVLCQLKHLPVTSPTEGVVTEITEAGPIPSV